MIRIGVIGYGYWGPNIVRNFNSIEGGRVVSICDVNPESQRRAQKLFPGTEITEDCRKVVSSPDVDAVAVVTPVSSHFELAKMALENGKHIFVEKPFTSTVRQAEILTELADKKNLAIMVDHTFLFTGAVRKIKQVIEDDTLGSLYYFDSIRVNLGLFQHDVNVVWDLAPHDLSIMDYLIDKNPVGLVATGESHINGFEDVAYLTIYFSDRMIAHLNVNWLSPVKVRTTLIGGGKKMLVWNDLDVDEKIKIYDKGVEVDNTEGIYDLLVSYRSGDMWVPRVDQIEALKVESQYFVDCIKNGTRPINDGLAGLRVVKMLEAADKSLRSRGELVEL
ncbi:MAG: putative oxidoreductase YdgJ [Syntrophorhabdaceae bacterium PtaU1.Bin034]|jgi:predicted dehydrogenase|nr:MAG: putative oxidoreductase YdgJ [Syntrophorhabdaceae bacterium PtaU1.Bin034]